MNISNREKLLLMLTVGLVMAFIFYKFLYSPLNRQLAAVKNENLNLNNRQSDIQRIGAEEDQRQSEIYKLQLKNKIMEEKIPRKEKLVELLDEMQTSAGKSGVKILTIDYQKEEAKQKNSTGDPDQQNSLNSPVKSSSDKAAGFPGLGSAGSKTGALKVMNLKISASGRYFQLLNFLLLIEKNQRIISVQSCNLWAENKKDTRTVSGSSINDSPPQQSNNQPSPTGDKQNTPTVATQSMVPAAKGRDKYDMNKMQMDFTIAAYYCP